MELHEHVTHLLMQLSPPSRSAFLLRDLNGLTTHEAAVISGVSDVTVKARLTRAGAKIRELVRPSPDAKFASAPTPTATPLSVVTVEAERPRVTGTARLRVRRALPRRKVLRERVSGDFVAGRKVA
jgi:hypothetical protein